MADALPFIKILMPSLKLQDGEAICNADDFRKLVGLALGLVAVDETWYLSHYPEVKAAIASGGTPSATQHYREWGFLEGRLPSAPAVDERWYTMTYPDVGEAITAGRFKNATEHFLKYGYREGRRPAPAEIPPSSESARRSDYPTHFSRGRSAAFTPGLRPQLPNPPQNRR